MADITVDVILPNAISVDATSPTQSLAANVLIPGPQGPRGEKGNPTSINSLTAENIIITGVDGNIAYTSGTSTIFISGNSGYFESKINTLTTNLDSTGSNLLSTINTASGTLQTQINNLDLNYATDAQLLSTGITLSNSINSLSGNLVNNYATINNLAATGSNLQNQINNLDNTYATDSDLFNTGSNLLNKINLLSGYFENENTIGFSSALSAGNDNYFINYPNVLNSVPRSVNCIFQNPIDDIIYYFSLGEINKTGFYVNFSDNLTNNGYFLNINVKK